MVPKSPIEQPIRHQIVLYDDFFHVGLHLQFIGELSSIFKFTVITYILYSIG